MMMNGDTSADSKPAVKSISRAAEILMCISDGISSLTGIADSCGLSKSTVHRLLKALDESHLTMQDRHNRRYYLGPMITRMTANPMTTHEYLIMCAVEEMRRLAGIFKETVHIGVLVAMQNIPLYEIPSTYDLRITEENRRLGSQLAGATMKILLSQLSDAKLRTVMRRVAVAPVTDRTITDKGVLLEQIKAARKNDYAVSYGEKVPGAFAVAAPVKGYTYPAALSIVGPESRMKSRMKEFIAEVQSSAGRVTCTIAETVKT